jgi:energy-coupling factor transporter ATP-binding protein EcfA2
MHIRHVAIENIRRFGSGAASVDLSLPPRGWIVVAGPNGAGKTTFLQVLALALSPTLQHEFADTLFYWLRRGAKRGSSRLTLVPSNEDGLRDGVENHSTKAPDEEYMVGDDWNAHTGMMSHGRESERNLAFAGPWNPNPAGWFAVGYGAHRRLFGQASATDAWAAGTTREGAFLTLFRDDASLVHPIRWLMGLGYRHLDSNVPTGERDEAKRIVDGVVALLNDGLLGETKVLRVDSEGLAVTQGEQTLSIQNLGAGAQALVALVVDIVRHMHARFGRLHFAQHHQTPTVEHGGVVLVDEVEAHLHPSWQRRIGTWLCEHFPNLQFIVTTHSPFVCQAATENGLILLPAPGSSETVQIAPEEVYRSVVNGSVDEVLLSGLFGLEHTWSEDAERKREHLATLEARVLTGKAKPAERAEYKRLLAEIPQTMSEDVERAAAQLTASHAVHAQKR